MTEILPRHRARVSARRAGAPAGPRDPRTPEPWEVAERPRAARATAASSRSARCSCCSGSTSSSAPARITIPGSSNTVGPRFFPYLVGAATIVVGGVLAIRVLRGDQGPEEAGEDVDPDAKTSWRAVGIIALAFLAHALLINVIGWPLSVTLMFGVVAWALGSRGRRPPAARRRHRLGRGLAGLRQGPRGAAARRHPARARRRAGSADGRPRPARARASPTPSRRSTCSSR